MTPEEVTLEWLTSESADDQNHDQEADLEAIGSPGGAAWASVAPESGPGGSHWHWAIYATWLWEDIEADPAATLAQGCDALKEEEAKAAVMAWVLTAREKP